jgi:hypothetical protein
VKTTGVDGVERAGGEGVERSSGTVTKSSRSSSEMLGGVIWLGFALVGGIGGDEDGKPSGETVGPAGGSSSTSSSETTTRKFRRIVASRFKGFLAGFSVSLPPRWGENDITNPQVGE